MKLNQAITERRIIKKFKSDEVAKEQLIHYFEQAKMAPNHRMTEPWNILFIGEKTREALNHKTNFGGAPAVFAVTYSHGANEIIKEENAVATACFMQNFMLLAWEDGIGTFWSSLGTSDAVREKLNVQDDASIIGIFACGYPEEIPQAKERADIETKIQYLD
ncbi:nitroreductase family protein [Metabacillus sp. GX 13764]|uniref:nitroreductase family protein n=1 Tax=Metabacillus kandeliae TaxID=2900151 RepID=UPI001E4FFDE1|nr:nitroreductase family protein [Metabacillus kandeliae]MCD7035249.1 nitroreductase family protein [Metabacillus kandeliae]